MTSKEFPCPMCDKVFLTNGGRLKHKKSFHFKLKSQCLRCPNQFSESSHLKRHVDSVHEKLKKHECDICEKKYYQKSHLKEHVQTAHGEEENSYFY